MFAAAVRAASVLMFAVFVLSACNPIPSSGPVEAGLAHFQQSERYGQFNPTGPVEGATQEDIVRGFVLAASSSNEDYSVAREFLTAEYASQWDPYFGVLIDEGTRPFRSDGAQSGVLSLSAVAKVDERGVMLPSKPGPSVDMRFEFTRVGGQWRISSAPAGVILDRITFSTVWSSYALFFIGVGGDLVPETRWFLKRAALTTEVVSELIAGPSEAMQDVLRSGFQPGVTLVGGSVTVAEGRARIDLSSDILKSGVETVREMTKQLQATLLLLPGVSGFELFAEGTPVRQLPSPQDPGTDPVPESYHPAVLREGQFGSLVAGEFAPAGALGAHIVQLDPEGVVLSSDEQLALVLGAAGVSRVDANGSSVVDARSSLLQPSLDPMGNIWSPRSVEPELLRVTSQSGVSFVVEAPWLRGRTPVSVRVSPDGSRIAALVPDGDTSSVLVSGIVRDEHGVPLSLSESAQVQMWVEGVPVDFDWVDPLRFAVLSRLGVTSRVMLGGPGLFANEQGSVRGGVSLSGGGSPAQLRVLNDAGELFSPQGSGWQRIASDVDVLSTHW